MATNIISTKSNMTQEEKDYLWPLLPLDAWKKTYETLHMWTQVVGKVKLELCPFLNQWWEVGFPVTARGLTTSLIPSPTGAFQVTFDFINHNLSLLTSDGKRKNLALMPRSVADFYQHFMTALNALGIQVKINTMPSEVENPIPFEQDHTHNSYDPEYVNRWWRILVQVDKLFQQYRSYFIGKSSPVLFYWGTFDLAESRYSEKRATPPPGANRIVRLSENQETIESGFWPGSGKVQAPAFYSFTYPKPAGLENTLIHPNAAQYNTDMGEFILLYEDVRKATSPERALLEFFQSTYEAGATLAHWNRQGLEQQPPNL
ncbi:MAG TPA: DUF5996 family protein [Ktedonobacteraceae bacterium]